MALTKTVNIDGNDVTFRASAAIPRIYRNKFQRDMSLMIKSQARMILTGFDKVFMDNLRYI